MPNNRALRLLLALTLVAIPAVGQVGAGDRDQSRYWQSSSSVVLPGRTTLRSEVINLRDGGRILVQSDGTVAPQSAPSSAAAWLWIAVDGVRASNVSRISWSGSIAPRPHCFNVVGSANLLAGRHVVTLEVGGKDGLIAIESRCNLSVFVNPAAGIVRSELAQQSADIQMPSTTLGASRCEWEDGLPRQEIVSIQPNNAPYPVYLFGSAYLTRSASAGDSMVGLFGTSATETLHASFSVQDLFPAAELEAPVYLHGVLDSSAAASGSPRVTLGGTEFPPSHHPTKPLTYKMGAYATLVGLYGGLQVHGTAGTVGGSAIQCAARCVGGTGSGCPPLNTNVVVSRAVIDIPDGHDGRVMFFGKLRAQGNPRDEAVRMELFLAIDDKVVGSMGVQELSGWLGGWDSNLSQRTMSVSFLATGGGALARGKHTVELVARANALTSPARVQRFSYWDDNPLLIWVD